MLPPNSNIMQYQYLLNVHVQQILHRVITAMKHSHHARSYLKKEKKKRKGRKEKGNMKKRREIRVTLIQKIRFRVKPCYSEERIKKIAFDVRQQRIKKLRVGSR